MSLEEVEILFSMQLGEINVGNIKKIKTEIKVDTQLILN
jgi:hypothetical protein